MGVCIGCHPNFVDRANLVAVGSVALERMKDSSDPMPPSGVLPAMDIAVIEAWISNGLPSGECAPVAIDAGIAGGGAGGGGGSAMTGGGGGNAMTGGGGGGGGGGGAAMTGGGGGGSTTGAPAAWVTYCEECHGPSGQGIATKGGDVQHPHSDTTASLDLMTSLVRVGDNNTTLTGTGGIVGPLETMKSFTPAQVSNADIAAIATWLRAMPRPTTGAALFQDFCAYCHGVNGQGGNQPDGTVAYASAYHSPPFVGNPTPPNTLTKFRTLIRNGVGTDPTMRKKFMLRYSVSELSDAEIALIAGWYCTTGAPTSAFCASGSVIP